MKVWVTKYALTNGIEEAEVKDDGDGMVSDRRTYCWAYYRTGEWHKTLEAAKSQAESMRLKRIASLLSQVDKLTALKF